MAFRSFQRRSSTPNTRYVPDAAAVPAHVKPVAAENPLVRERPGPLTVLSVIGVAALVFVTPVRFVVITAWKAVVDTTLWAVEKVIPDDDVPPSLSLPQDAGTPGVSAIADDAPIARTELPPRPTDLPAFGSHRSIALGGPDL